jgi:acetoin utilization deacetylase AcuC-like enzyme
VIELAQAEDLLDIRIATFDAEATWADIARVHDQRFVEAVRHGRPKEVAQSQGFRWSPEFADALVRIWNGQYAAAKLALETGGIVFHPVSGAHHAGFSRGSGFCTFNFLAGIALRTIRERLVNATGIIDLDAHTGNGTFYWVENEPGLAAFDISGGDWLGNVTYPSWAEYYVAHNAVQYAQFLERLPAWLDRTKPEIVFYQAGIDCWEQDGVGGIDGVTAEFLSVRDRFVLGHLVQREIPTVINLGGGYEAHSPELHVLTARIAVDLLQDQARVGVEIC